MIVDLSGYSTVQLLLVGLVSTPLPFSQEWHMALLCRRELAQRPPSKPADTSPHEIK